MVLVQLQDDHDHDENARVLAKLLSAFDVPPAAPSGALLASRCDIATTPAGASCAQFSHPRASAASIDTHHSPDSLLSSSQALPPGNLNSQPDSLQWVPQPTRSGRIPQRPDPNSSFINPIDFLEFPTDSESDDPDFQPPPETTKSSQEPKPGPSSSADAVSLPAINWAQQLLGASGLSTADLLSQFGKYSALENHSSSASRARPTAAPAFDLGFDFSNVHPSWTPDPPPPMNQQPDQIKTSRAARSAAGLPTHPPINTITTVTTTKKHSPLTAGSLAGIPFVQISLPDSDDSPEFVPPPPKRSRRDSSLDPLCSPTRSSTSAQVRHHYATRSPNRAVLSSRHPDLRPVSPSRFSHSSRHPPPRPVPPTKPPNLLTVTSPRESVLPESPCDSLAETEYAPPTVRLNKKGLPCGKPGPKPRPKPELAVIERENLMRRKREGMRAVRERKKEYVEELEDQCRFLKAENERLKEENEQLMRESRENWRARALALSRRSHHQRDHAPSVSTSNSSPSGPKKIGGKVVRSIAPNLHHGRTVLDVMATKRSSRGPG